MGLNLPLDTSLESLKAVLDLGTRYKCKRIQIGTIAVDFTQTEPEPTGPAEFELPPEAAPPDGDALLYYSTPLAPGLEEEPLTGV